MLISKKIKLEVNSQFGHEVGQETHKRDGVAAIDLGIKALAVGGNEQGHFYHIGGFKRNRYYKTYHYPNPDCCLVMDRDKNSAVNILKRFFARLGPHMERISMRCADVFTAIDDVNTFEHI